MLKLTLNANSSLYRSKGKTRSNQSLHTQSGQLYRNPLLILWFWILLLLTQLWPDPIQPDLSTDTFPWDQNFQNNGQRWGHGEKKKQIQITATLTTCYEVTESKGLIDCHGDQKNKKNLGPGTFMKIHEQNTDVWTKNPSMIGHRCQHNEQAGQCMDGTQGNDWNQKWATLVNTDFSQNLASQAKIDLSWNLATLQLDKPSKEDTTKTSDHNESWSSAPQANSDHSQSMVIRANPACTTVDARPNPPETAVKEFPSSKNPPPRPPLRNRRTHKKVKRTPLHTELKQTTGGPALPLFLLIPVSWRKSTVTMTASCHWHKQFVQTIPV